MTDEERRRQMDIVMGRTQKKERPSATSETYFSVNNENSMMQQDVVSLYSHQQAASSSYSSTSNSNYRPSEISSKVKAIIVEKLGVDEAEVADQASFTNDLGADSLDTVELIMQIEKEFGVTIPDDQAEKISSVGDAIAFIEANAR